MSPTARTVDQTEVDRFSRIAAEWWDPKGKFKPLHKFNPARLGYLKREICGHFSRNADAADSFTGLDIVDIGCGGGLISEPMARLGARVTGIDPSETNIEVARLHAGQSGLAIDYRPTTAEDLDAAGDRFDVVLALEVIEHVADVQAFLETVSNLVRPGGLLVVATLNRTIKALGLAIIGAEYVLRWLPRGTHSWDKFVKPEEVEAPLQDFGLTLLDRSGIVFDPFRDTWKESRDTDVNYVVLAAKPKG
jgi:2-polyprenyl-6-hydroxyphenyl methylase / 3-demethylubiquinone-9 3-methyltransferase